MSGIQIVQVDERDSGWERHEARFRVYLHGSAESATLGWTDTYDVTGADIMQVIDWAQRQVGDSLMTYAIALVHDDDRHEQLNPGRGRGLVWLVGVDGNDRPCDGAESDAQDRMLARRQHPVEVAAADRMPPDVPDPYNDGTEARAH